MFRLSHYQYQDADRGRDRDRDSLADEDLSESMLSSAQFSQSFFSEQSQLHSQPLSLGPVQHPNPTQHPASQLFPQGLGARPVPPASSATLTHQHSTALNPRRILDFGSVAGSVGPFSAKDPSYSPSPLPPSAAGSDSALNYA